MTTITITLGDVDYTRYADGFVEGWHDWKGFIGGFYFDQAPTDIVAAFEAAEDDDVDPVHAELGTRGDDTFFDRG